MKPVFNFETRGLAYRYKKKSINFYQESFPISVALVCPSSQPPQHNGLALGPNRGGGWMIDHLQTDALRCRIISALTGRQRRTLGNYSTFRAGRISGGGGGYENWKSQIHVLAAGRERKSKEKRSKGLKKKKAKWQGIDEYMREQMACSLPPSP